MKLRLENGIIMNDAIAGVPFRRAIIQPSANEPRVGEARRVRTLQAMKHYRGVTIHNTGSARAGANAANHAVYLQRLEGMWTQYVSYHFVVDASEIVQLLPLTEVGWHAGDGAGDGNMTTYGIEICENEDMDYGKSERNGQILAAALLKACGGALYKHQDWSGKYCPHIILREGRWERFKEETLALAREERLDPPMRVVVNQSKPPQASEVFYRVQVGAYSSRDNAVLLRNELEQKGYSPFVIEVRKDKKE